MISFEKTQLKLRVQGFGVGEACAGANLSTGSLQEPSFAGSPSLRSLESDSNSPRIEGMLDLFACTCVCVHVRTCMCTGICARVWKPEVKLRCLF